MDEKYPDGGAGNDYHDIGPPPTGDDRVDAAMSELSRLPGTPADEHVAVLEEIHGRLRDILGQLGLGQLDDGPAPGARGRR